MEACYVKFSSLTWEVIYLTGSKSDNVQHPGPGLSLQAIIAIMASYRPLL